MRYCRISYKQVDYNMPMRRWANVKAEIYSNSFSEYDYINKNSNNVIRDNSLRMKKKINCGSFQGSVGTLNEIIKKEEF